MNSKCVHLAMAACMAVSLLASTASASFSGAIYTSLGNGQTVNANNYDNCADVFLNGGPQNANAQGLPDGEYYFQVTNPNGGALLSTTPADERRVQVVDGVIFGRAADLDPAGYDDGSMIHHIEGSVNPNNGSKPVQLWHFNDTTNSGGVYKVWLIPVEAATIAGDDITLLFDGGNSKTDNFRCVHEGGTGQNTVLVTGRKYYDVNANGVDDGESEDWTDADGRPRVIIEFCYTAPEETEVCVDLETDSTGNWGFLIPEGSSFTACEQLPNGYNQTGPLDPDSIVNGDASAGADADGCWAGNVTLVGLVGLSFGNVDTATIGGFKFYDANADGVWDGGEPAVGDFKIKLKITYSDDSTAEACVFTNPNGSDDGITDGSWEYELPIGASVEVCEIMPLGSWVQTFPDGTGVDDSSCNDCPDAGPWGYEILVEGDRNDLNFGNVCLGAGGGHTLGYWSNKNGKATMEAYGMAAALAELSALNLRNADGSDFNPASYNQFRTWLLNATATNMAYMLSAQLAAMHLNVQTGFVEEGALVWNSCTGFTTIGALMTAANESLGSYGDTTSPHDERSDQECLKNVLDDANNNLNFVQEQPCDVEYPPEA